MTVLSGMVSVGRDAWNATVPEKEMNFNTFCKRNDKKKKKNCILLTSCAVKRLDFGITLGKCFFYFLDYVTPTELFQIGHRKNNYMYSIYHNLYIVCQT